MLLLLSRMCVKWMLKIFLRFMGSDFGHRQCGADIHNRKRSNRGKMMMMMMMMDLKFHGGLIQRSGVFSNVAEEDRYLQLVCNGGRRGRGGLKSSMKPHVGIGSSKSAALASARHAACRHKANQGTSCNTILCCINGNLIIAVRAIVQWAPSFYHLSLPLLYYF